MINNKTKHPGQKISEATLTSNSSQAPTSTLTNEMLHKSLTELSILDQKSLDDCLYECSQNNGDLGEMLYKHDLLDAVSLGRIIGDLIGLPYVNLAEVAIPDEVLKIIPEAVAKNQQIIAYQKDDNSLFVATSNPWNNQIIDFLSKKTGVPVQVRYSTVFCIKNALSLYEKDIASAFDEIISENIKEFHLNKDIEPPIIKIVDSIIEHAYNSSASDIHIEPLEENTLIRFRIDGVLHDIHHLPPDLDKQIVTRLKVMANLRTDEHQDAQDGKLVFKMDEEDLDIRVSIAPITRGEKVVMRLLSERSRQFSLEDLGMSESDLIKVQTAYHKPHGLLLATGPTGSGKTTTLYAILKLLNKRDVNIMTIEDPVEYQMDNVNQIQVNPKTELTFAKGLRSIVRQDPDVILVGEIRDDETADIAINSAMTGHLVLSTLHTNDAVTAFPRMMDMNIEGYLVASSVNVIIAQRLVRKICTKCKVSVELPVEGLDPQILKHLGRATKIQTYKGKGCPVCHQTGYMGRIGVFEVLETNEELNAAIISKKSTDDLRKLALKSGMKTMMEDGIEKVKQGLTTIEELLRVTTD